MGKFNKDFIENITNTSIRDANWSSMAGNGKSQNDIRETYPHVFFPFAEASGIYNRTHKLPYSCCFNDYDSIDKNYVPSCYLT